MIKVFEFLKSKKLEIQWTIGYFVVLWFILKYLFKFDMFSGYYWHRFFHSTFHGFGGFVFCILVYSAIPIYIATTMVIHRTKTPLVTIPFIGKISEYLSKIFPKKETKETTTEEPEQKIEEPAGPEFPKNLPPELRIPFIRAKNNISLHTKVSVFNKQENKDKEPDATPESFSEILPTDFEIPDFENDINNSTENNVPVFTDINFDNPEPQQKPEELENNTTKYLSEKNIKYETYKNFVVTDKFVIYEHKDSDFWIMDESTWFASGKQIDSPISEIKQIAQQNALTPVIYLKSENIMDIENTINQFESDGIRVVKSLDDLE